MSPKEFFKVKREWSVIKDNILGWYLKPYFTKLLRWGREIVYVDGFSGPGTFEDGNKGSPLIVLDLIETIAITQKCVSSLNMFFIDGCYAEELKNRISSSPRIISVINGKFEDHIGKILSDSVLSNVFLYLDPFGIKGYNLSEIVKYSEENSKIEILLNFNGFGFYREACRQLSIEPDINDYPPDEEEETCDFAQATASDLDKVMGSENWRNIVSNHRSNSGGVCAEKALTEEVCHHLSSKFNYVLNIPIRLKKYRVPKYRMIHATNHEDGCVIMYDNLYKRKNELSLIQSSGQFSLLEEDVDNQIVTESEILEEFKIHLESYSTYTKINKCLADFYISHGITLSSSKFKEHVKLLEANHVIEVWRKNELTPSGKKSASLVKEIMLRKAKI